MQAHGVFVVLVAGQQNATIADATHLAELFNFCTQHSTGCLLFYLIFTPVWVF